MVIKSYLVRALVVFSLIGFLVSCGGGGGSDSAAGGNDTQDKEPAVSGSITVTPNTLVLSDLQTAQIANTSTNTDGTTQLITTQNSSLGTDLEVGSVIMVTGGADSRFPLGFAGKVVSVATGNDGTTSATLTNASFADVAQKSSFQSNEIALNSTNFIGVISPAAVKASTTAKSQSLSLLRHGKTALSGGVVLSEPNNVGVTLNSAIRHLTFQGDGNLDLGRISLNFGAKILDLVSNPKLIRPFGAGAEARVDLKGSLENLKLIYNYNYSYDIDVSASLKPDIDINSIDMRVIGDVNVDVKFQGGVEAEFGYFSRAWNEVKDAGATLFGVSGKLTGLDSKDKIGDIPLIGLVFSVPCPQGCPVSFAQEKTQSPLRLAQAGGVIVWVYLTLNGEIKLDGEIGTRIYEGRMNVGLQKPENGEYDFIGELINTGTGSQRFIETPYVDGNVAASLRFGPSFDVDFFVAGVRPINASLFVGTQIDATLETNSEISYGREELGNLWTWAFHDGLCVEVAIGAGNILSGALNLGVEIDTPFGEVDSSLEYSSALPTEEQMLIPGWHYAWYTLPKTRRCFPAPVVNKIITKHNVLEKSLIITVSGLNLPDDLLLNVSSTASCERVLNPDFSDTSVKYICQLTDAMSTLDFDLTSQMAENIDLSPVTDQLNYRLGPFPPMNIAANAGDGQVAISWDIVSNATSYNLYWGTVLPVNKTTGTKITDILNNSYVHTGLDNGTNYYYTVTGVNASGESEEGDNSGLVAIPRSILNDRVLTLSEREGNWEIYSVSLDGADSINLTNDFDDDILPSLSPERGRIAFVSDRDGNKEIYVMTSDGESLTRLTNNSDDDVTPIWSPDGKKIVFVSKRDGNFEIYVIDADGENEIRLTNNSADDAFPNWSPDSKRITFVSQRDGNEEVYIMNANGIGDVVNHTSSNASDNIPNFSPDGSWISFVSDRDGSFDLWVMDANGSSLRKITTAENNGVGWYAWSPDGSQIAFDSEQDGDYEVYITNFDGTNVRQLTTNSATDQFATWFWDGSKIVFISDRDGSNQIYVMDPDGGNPVNISNDSSTIALPMFSPVYLLGGAVNLDDCFIATAAYGSYLEPEVMLLREFRDEYLLTNDVGKAFVKYYYKLSPPVADVIAGHEPLRIIVRMGLTPLVYAVKYPAVSSVLFMLLIFAFILYLRVYKKKMVLQ